MFTVKEERAMRVDEVVVRVNFNLHDHFIINLFGPDKMSIVGPIAFGKDKVNDNELVVKKNIAEKFENIAAKFAGHPKLNLRNLSLRIINGVSQCLDAEHLVEKLFQDLEKNKVTLSNTRGDVSEKTTSFAWIKVDV